MGLALQRLTGKAAPRQAVALPRPQARQTLRERFAKGSVEWSLDLQRVMELPRRTKPELEVIAKALTQLLRKPGGTQELRELQAWGLVEAPKAGGLIAAAQTGSGKTLWGMLMPMCWPWIEQEDGTRRPPRCVLLIPANMRAQFAADWERYGQHWQLPNLAGGRNFLPGLPTLHVVSYSELQQPKNSALLEQLQPELLMGDEISALRNFEAARTIRARRFFARFYQTAFCGWDATITADSLEDIWHLLAWALGENSPMPVEPAEVRRWARAIDPARYQDGYYLPGELMKFCLPHEDVRAGFQRRFVDTLGVITSEDQRLGIPLVFKQRMPPMMPLQIIECLKVLRRPHNQSGWRRPDGEELQEATQVVACARQLATGMYLRWRYPRGEPLELIDEWFDKRQAWNRELRAQLLSPLVHMDSPKLCENAAARWYDGGCPDCHRKALEWHGTDCKVKETHPLWPAYTFLPWREIAGKVYHETEVVWMSDWLVEDIAVWMHEAPGIVWVEHPELGHRLAQKTGLTYFGEGEKAAEEIDRLYGDNTPRSTVSIIASVKAHMRGKNLQTSFSRNLIVSFPASNTVVEQLAGRTYRQGQTADRVTVDYYLHVPEFDNALTKAKERAKYVWETMGTSQKMIYGQWERAA
jgi:hypothetical protein